MAARSRPVMQADRRKVGALKRQPPAASAIGMKTAAANNPTKASIGRRVGEGGGQDDSPCGVGGGQPVRGGARSTGCAGGGEEDSPCHWVDPRTSSCSLLQEHQAPTPN